MIHTWSDADKGIIRERFDQSYASILRLASYFSVSPDAVTHMVARMGLRQVRRHRWTPEEDAALERELAIFPVDEVVRTRKRSLCAIVVRAKRLGIGSNHRNEWYTAEDAAQILGMNQTSVMNRVKAGTLKAVPHNSERVPRKGHSGSWHISQVDLVAYIKRYPEDLQGRNVDMVALVDILAGGLTSSASTTA